MILTYIVVITLLLSKENYFKDRFNDAFDNPKNLAIVE